MKSLILAVLATLFLFTSSTTCFARSPSESDFVAAQLTGEDISNWVQNLPKPIKSMGIFSVHVSLPLESDFANIVESDVIKGFQSMSSMRVMICEECRTPQVQLKGDRLVITKGSPDLDVLQKLGKKMEIESFMTLDVYRTKLSLITQANIYDAGSGQIIATEEFKVPAFDLNDSSAQIILKFGPGVALGGNSNPNSTSSMPPLGGDLQLLEELGFGKGGLTVGGAGGTAGSMWFVMPTIAWRGRFGASGLSTLKGINLGFGETGSTFGLAGGLSYDLFIGSFTNVGLQFFGILPTSSNNNNNSNGSSSNGITAFVGVSLGFSVGR